MTWEQWITAINGGFLAMALFASYKNLWMWSSQCDRLVTMLEKQLERERFSAEKREELIFRLLSVTKAALPKAGDGHDQFHT